MYEKIIIGYDDSDQAKDALALARKLGTGTGAELVLSAVALFHPMMRGGLDPIALEDEHELGKRAEAAAAEIGATCRNVGSTSVPRGLHELAEEIGADLVVVGSSSHGAAGQTLLGNVGVALLHGSSSAVAVAPHGYRDAGSQPISTVVVGYDGSAEAQVALDSAAELARATGAQVRIVGAAEPPPVVYGKSGGMSGGWGAIKDEVERELREKLEAAAAALDVDADVKVVAAAPAEALAGEAAAPGSILFLASRGYGPVRRVLLGSVSRALAGAAPAPVVIHPRGSDTRHDLGAPAEAGTAA